MFIHKISLYVQTSQLTKPSVPWIWPINKVVMKFYLHSFICMHLFVKKKKKKKIKPESQSFMQKESLKMDYQAMAEY